MYSRWIEKQFEKTIKSPYVHILFGARQTGKSTLLRKVVKKSSLWIDFSNPALKAEHIRYPELFINQCKAIPASDRSSAIIVIDEAQTVPSIFDAVQNLYDTDKNRWKFILCGSSARKIRSSSVNLLPGRSIMHSLYPLVKAERPFSDITGKYGAYSPFHFDFPCTSDKNQLFPSADLIERLTYGELPGIVCAPKEVRNELLKTYSLVYIEEEIRREASIKNLAAFSRFIQLAATESGNMLNYAKIAKDAAVTIPTIKSYFQLLEEMFISFRIPAFSGSSRKRLLSTEKSFFFDLGVRHASVGLKACEETVLANPGPIFEQWVGIELWKRLKYTGEGMLYYMRTTSGSEIDYIIDLKGKYIPIEVKWTEHPDKHDAKHLESFIKDHKHAIDRGFIICRCKHPMEISKNILAIPWYCL